MIVYCRAVLSFFPVAYSLEFPHINTLYYVVTCNYTAEPLFAVFPACVGGLTAEQFKMRAVNMCVVFVDYCHCLLWYMETSRFVKRSENNKTPFFFANVHVRSICSGASHEDVWRSGDAAINVGTRRAELWASRTNLVTFGIHWIGGARYALENT